jgi:TorA maturation chaperone TorD
MEYARMQSPRGEELYERLAGEALICGLLGKVLYTYPDRAWMLSLASEGVFDEIPFDMDASEEEAGEKSLKEWTRQSRHGLDDEAYDALRSDYTRLFIGPGRPLAPPWESVSLSITGLTFQAETLEVRRWYARHGLQFEKLHKEPDDHIGIELAFIAHLAGGAVRALEDGDEAAFNRAIAAQAGFLSEHPLRWGPEWCQQMIEAAKTGFYQGIGRLTLSTLNELSRIARSDLRETSAG